MEGIEQVEEWRGINNCPDYEISRNGHVRNRITGDILHTTIANTGYRIVSLGRFHSKQIHRLLAEAFIGPVEGMEVDHIDRNRTNNDLANLRIVSHSANQRNRTSYNGRQCQYVNELPPDAILVERYGNHTFDNLYYADGEFYTSGNGREYRHLEVLTKARDGHQNVNARDTNGKLVKIMILHYRRMINEIE
jgi:hypothetical protein